MRYDVQRELTHPDSGKTWTKVIISGPYDTEAVANMHCTRLAMQHEGEIPQPTYTVVVHQDIEGEDPVASVR